MSNEHINEADAQEIMEVALRARLRWVLEATGTANEHVRRLYDGPLPGPPARAGQFVFEGDEDAFEEAKAKAERRAWGRCGFCDGPRPCSRDD